MNKFLLINIFCVLFAEFLFASSVSVSILDEDFENGGYNFTKLLQSSNYLKIDEKNAISGKHSLVFDSTKSNSEWFLYANFGRGLIEQNSLYEVSFKYDFKACQAQSADCYFGIASPKAEPMEQMHRVVL